MKPFDLGPDVQRLTEQEEDTKRNVCTGKKRVQLLSRFSLFDSTVVIEKRKEVFISGRGIWSLDV